MRYVSCRDNQGGVAEESACAHLPKPPAREVCSVVACGQWKVLEWTAVRKPPVIMYSTVTLTVNYSLMLLQLNSHELTKCCRGPGYVDIWKDVFLAVLNNFMLIDNTFD